MADLPAGTVIEIRLLTSVSSYHSKPGDEVRALLVAPLCPQSIGNGHADTTVRGIVKRIRKVGLGLVHETARLEFEFRELRLPDGRTYPLRGRLVSVDNGRERVDRHGSIHGDRATGSLSHRFGYRLARAALDHPIFLIPVLAVETGLFHFPDPEINYGPGTELHLKVEDALPLCDSSAGPSADTASADERDGLRDLIAGLPYWAYSPAQTKPAQGKPVQGKPMDPTNLIFIGAQEELDRAFTMAGWTGSRTLSVSSGLQLMRAAAESRAYAEAPMRTLLLDGAGPDVTRQKSLNTFTKRHHIRMWKRLEEWHGRPVWVSAATKDIAASFSLRPFGFTHQIENDIDVERDKVVSDLVFTGCVDSVEYISRPEMARFCESEGRRGVSTDARIAVLALNSCQAPRQISGVADDDRKPVVAVRVVRRVTLTVRNHFIRENLPWRVGEASVTGVRFARGWYLQRTRAQTAALAASRKGAKCRSSSGGS